MRVSSRTREIYSNIKKADKGRGSPGGPGNSPRRQNIPGRLEKAHLHDNMRKWPKIRSAYTKYSRINLGLFVVTKLPSPAISYQARIVAIGMGRSDLLANLAGTQKNGARSTGGSATSLRRNCPTYSRADAGMKNSSPSFAMRIVQLQLGIARKAELGKS